jgi:hypothetical protein
VKKKGGKQMLPNGVVVIHAHRHGGLKEKGHLSKPSRGKKRQPLVSTNKLVDCCTAMQDIYTSSETESRKALHERIEAGVYGEDNAE